MFFQDLQYFGIITSGEQSLNAMLCVDEDRPDEAMLHWWANGVPSEAALVSISEQPDGSATLAPQLLYCASPSGGLWVPQLTQDQHSEIKSYRAELRIVGNSIVGNWRNEQGKSGTLMLNAPQSDLRVVSTVCSDWGGFKQWAENNRDQHDLAAYRGHGSNTFRLQTTLHRTRRARLERYCAEVLPEFHRHAEALLSMKIDMEDARDYAMIAGLAQHHGLPTPLLDWTKSPYIAAFFAFADAIDNRGNRKETSHVRIYGLTRSFFNWTIPTVTLPFIQPYVAPLSISPLNNPRLYAQQGSFIVTNIADVESFICKMQTNSNTTYLIAADVPISVAQEALEDLAFMGLTAATMFPGLDGVCRAIKHQMSFSKHRSKLTGDTDASSAKSRSQIKSVGDA